MTKHIDLLSWVGRTETRRDVIAAAPLRGLAALLDYDTRPWGETMAPPLAHWLYFLPSERQSELGEDGHPKRGAFLPPIDLPRRMWAGGRLRFHNALPVGARVERLSRIKEITPKRGGELVFVTLLHIISSDGVCMVEEEQDLVFRGDQSAVAIPQAEADGRSAAHERSFCADSVALFRFSALTFNAHRIHYDRDYATQREGYPGLVVHGPYLAILLLDHFSRTTPAAKVREFSFRAQRPLFAGEPATLCAGPGGELWCRNGAGVTTMSARVGVE